jgi:hypothetical protein
VLAPEGRSCATWEAREGGVAAAEEEGREGTVLPGRDDPPSLAKRIGEERVRRRVWLDV